MGNDAGFVEKVCHIMRCQLLMEHFDGSLGVQMNMLPQAEFMSKRRYTTSRLERLPVGEPEVEQDCRQMQHAMTYSTVTERARRRLRRAQALPGLKLPAHPASSCAAQRVDAADLVAPGYRPPARQ